MIVLEEATNESVTDYKKLEKPTIARVKSGETKLPPRTNYNTPPSMRNKEKAKKAADRTLTIMKGKRDSINTKPTVDVPRHA